MVLRNEKVQRSEMVQRSEKLLRSEKVLGTGEMVLRSEKVLRGQRSPTALYRWPSASPGSSSSPLYTSAGNTNTVSGDWSKAPAAGDQSIEGQSVS